MRMNAKPEHWLALLQLVLALCIVAAIIGGYHHIVIALWVLLLVVFLLPVVWR